jgi:hypothetical protein
MSIKREYFSYLNHFDKTVPVCELYHQPKSIHLVALRHDIDYDLDLALELAFWECDKNCRATYFLLNTAEYWQDPLLLEKCLQLQDFGHEVGLHVNVLTEWMSGNVSDIGDYILQLLKPLREGGVRISGIAPHGDKSCYENNFINYWCFSELRPENPLETENGLSAEGIPVSAKGFQIQYPASHQLIRKDGDKIDLWSVPMKDLGLEYDAIHIPYGKYYTDSGGTWERSSDPKLSNLSEGRHQILMHPIFWKGPQKVYFFLSTARTGSKWLINMLDKATPVTARHEFTLNHYLCNGNLVKDKRTAAGFTDLVCDRDKAKELIHQTRDWVEDSDCDYAEANIYLEQFLPEFQEVFPDACTVHLFRDPRDVVRSIINRSWYDTPEDNAHPVMDVKGFSGYSQFAKACWYVRKTNESLASFCEVELQFERMVSEQDYLALKLRELGIAFFPLLVRADFHQKINVNQKTTFPPYEQWSTLQKSKFHSICGPVNAMLGYKDESHFNIACVVKKRQQILLCPRHVVHLQAGLKVDEVTARGCRVVSDSSGLLITPTGEGHAHVLLGGGSWHTIKPPSGWKSKRGFYYHGSLSVETESKKAGARLMCLMYDHDGQLFSKRTIGYIRPDKNKVPFSFRVSPGTRRYNLAVYMPVGTLTTGAVIKGLQLEEVPFSESNMEDR